MIQYQPPSALAGLPNTKSVLSVAITRRPLTIDRAKEMIKPIIRKATIVLRCSNRNSLIIVTPHP